MTDQDYRVGVAARLLAIFTGLVLIVPTLVVIPLSFTDRMSFKFPPAGWSIKFYRNLLIGDEWRGPLISSVQLALVVMVISVVIGLLASVGITRGKLKIANALNIGFLAPMIVPSIVFAIAIYFALLKLHLFGTFAGFVIAHTVIAIPFPIVTITAGLRGLDTDLERAAATQGANRLTAFTHVTLPLLVPSVLAGAAFAFITSFDEIVVSLFIQSTQFRTLPVKMFTSVSTESDPTIAAAASVVIVISTSLLVGAQMLTKVLARRRNGA